MKFIEWIANSDSPVVMMLAATLALSGTFVFVVALGAIIQLTHGWGFLLIPVIALAGLWAMYKGEVE